MKLERHSKIVELIGKYEIVKTDVSVIWSLKAQEGLLLPNISVF